MIRIPKGVTYINKNAFEECENLETVVLPKTLISIAGYAFWRCTSLESVTFNEGLRIIGRNAFQSCTSLESVTMLVSEENLLTRWLKDVSPYNFSTSKAALRIPESLRGWATENDIERKFDRIEYLS